MMPAVTKGPVGKSGTERHQGRGCRRLLRVTSSQARGRGNGGEGTEGIVVGRHARPYGPPSRATRRHNRLVRSIDSPTRAPWLRRTASEDASHQASAPKAQGNAERSNPTSVEHNPGFHVSHPSNYGTRSRGAR